MTRSFCFRLLGVGTGLFALGCGASPSEHSSGTDAGEVQPFADADADAQAEAEGVSAANTPAITSLEIGDGHRVAFHEVGERLIIAESAQNGVPSVLAEPRLATMTPLEIYEALRPGQSAPTELVDAIERLQAARARSPQLVDDAVLEPTFGGGASVLLPAPAPAGVGQLAEPLSESYFRNTLQGCAVS